MNDWFSPLFGQRSALIGMIHVGPLPGAPGWSGDLGAILDRAVEEAILYQQAGFHGLLLENMYDRPYMIGDRVGPETVAAMAVLGHEVRRAVQLPLGVQVLAAANQQALAVALACGASFIRVEGFAYAHVADEGWIEGCAGQLVRSRDQWKAGHIRIITDIKKKHSSHAVTADLSLLDVAHGCEFFLADGLIVTGSATGQPADPGEVRLLAGHSSLPVFVGSGLTPENLAEFSAAQGFIIGSSVKQGGVWDGALDTKQIARLRTVWEGLKATEGR
ncbi:BtpA/SgcQ family protein [bacterium]|nr:BtpA/SgcQ family protein [bacterium]